MNFTIVEKFRNFTELYNGHGTLWNFTNLRFEGVRCSVLNYRWSLYSLACNTQHVPALGLSKTVHKRYSAVDTDTAEETDSQSDSSSDSGVTHSE